MKLPRQALPFTLVTVLCVAGSCAFAGPQSANATDQRPQMEDFSDPERFVQELLAWKRREKSSEGSRGEDTSKTGSVAREGDWHDITGPETLEGALQKANGYTPPDYEAQYRFNRTTHLSFPLPRLEGEQMSGQAITGGLREQTQEAPSLEPLPEMRMILEEAGEEEEIGAPDGRAFLPAPNGLRRQTVQVNTR